MSALPKYNVGKGVVKVRLVERLDPLRDTVKLPGNPARPSVPLDGRKSTWAPQGNLGVW